MKVGIKFHVFLYGQVLIKAKFLRHIGNAALDCLRLFDAVQPQYAQLSFCRIHQSRYKPHKGGFPGSIRTNNGCQLPFFHSKIKILKGFHTFSPFKGKRLIQFLGTDYDLIHDASPFTV